MEKKFNIYTKTGDDGTSGLIGGTRVKKYDLRLDSYGTIDELNSWIGLIRSKQIEDQVTDTLIEVQNKLFLIGSHLATDDSKSDLKDRLQFDTNVTKRLENEIDRMQEALPPLANFILPGGNELAGYTHIARTVCRRAERRVVELSEGIKIDNNIVVFINRLSDYLFVLARFICLKQGIQETFWKPEK